MSSTNMEEKVKEQELGEDTLKDQVVFDGGDVDHSVEELKDSDQNGENSVAMPSPQQEEEAIKKKYGGILPKKKPLISKDQDRAFFDSADWALGKQGAQKPKGPLEALRPKLQPSPQHQVRSRRSAYAPADDCDGVDDGHNRPSEDEKSTLDAGNDKNTEL
ncbi:uncharacterized protein LOC110614678 isoform X1 [Manihot esculenta]|uniref:Negatively light-regulated protein n=2 Tax=Manihot esculenta TaxID=3983 RepID=A0A251KVJ7_MANES|nr:uncharacterized protein LOC110614678 isoform X1 [Manihot esculenta]XP_021611984.1 uncharacterized protein LOC110614678 isoform X1 [Manihot esculenta]XP_021611985.1 uncharacterized protein LOC110614678 isoform X1 [Manihot esculenta]XP_021611986.1 uncharacterized protein LOC110614678 isoform X1 [Manihot esculenta]KAG8654141.1 hypothetical protein MANES_05G104200v8 [Manihot esculenta]OAY50049.1 hypothetical protein MANES_05G104200v8 [Manihot esculenta]OAY50050.1 hypothetical protein MANES_05G